ncbi:MAG: TraB domain-containing protein [Candidatus Thermoplasmatota archaeon]
MPDAAATPPAAGPAPHPPPGRLTIIGTGHVFQVRDTIRLAMQALQPDIAFVELDRGRLHALQQRAKGIPPPTGGSFVHQRLQRFQEDVAGAYGAHVGEEMLAAVEGAQMVGARIALIDPPADATVGRVLKDLTWRERARALGLLVKGGVQSLWRRGPKTTVEAEIKRYQDDPDKALEELRQQFPTIHRIVIAERDAVMARRIAHLLKGARHGVAVVGDGHVPGLMRLLDDLKPTVYRLADVRNGKLPRPVANVATGTPASISFGFNVTGTFGPIDPTDPPQP